MTDMHARLTAPKRRKIVLTKNWRGQYRWTLWTNSRKKPKLNKTSKKPKRNSKENC